MTTELMEGLRLAGVGMGLVFATLVALMVILFALGKLFPGEEVEQEAADTWETIASAAPPAPEATTAAAAPVDAPPQVEASPAPQPTAVAAPAPSRDGVTGERIAALAVSVYLAMEQEEAERAAAAASTGTAVQAGPQPAQHSSSWGSLGRAALWRSQGRRPPAYGHRPHSAYNPTRGGRA